MIFAYAQILLTGLLSQCISLTGAMHLDPRQSGRRGGLKIDASCDPYRAKVDRAVIVATNLALAGFKEAQYPNNPLFKVYFEPGDVQTVRNTFRNAKEYLRSQEGSIVIKCNEDKVCLDSTSNAYAWVVPGHSSQEYVNLCRHTLDGGPRSLIVRNDFCNWGWQDNLATQLLHEMIHVPKVGPAEVLVKNEVYDVVECQKLASGRTKDAQGKIIRPIWNPSNYVWMAEASLFTAYQADPKKCPPDHGNDLRKLQSANDTTAGITVVGTGSIHDLANVTATTNDTILQVGDITVPEEANSTFDYGPFALQIPLNSTQEYVLSDNGQVTP